MQNVEIAICQTANDNVTFSNESVAALALANENIVGARCFLYENKFVLALLCTPFYLKSERDNFVKTIAHDLSNQTNSDVVVTLDLEIYRKIKPDMTPLQKESLYQKVVARI